VFRFRPKEFAALPDAAPVDASPASAFVMRIMFSLTFGAVERVVNNCFKFFASKGMFVIALPDATPPSLEIEDAMLAISPTPSTLVPAMSVEKVFNADEILLNPLVSIFPILLMEFVNVDMFLIPLAFMELAAFAILCMLLEMLVSLDVSIDKLF
jgi:hypothetical protein